MTLLLAVLLSFGPTLAAAAFVYWLDRYEKEPQLLLGVVFGWGAVIAVLGAVVAQLTLSGAVTAISGSEKAADVAGITLFGPLTEESIKGFAVLVIFLALRHEFDSLLDGLVYAAVVALGFAATEDVLYLYGAAEEKGVAGMMDLFILRIVMGIWNHPFYTAFIGVGLAISRLSRSFWVSWSAPVVGWGLACFFHALHNAFAMMAESLPFFLPLMFLVDWGGWLFMAVLILAAIHHESRLLRAQLIEEVSCGRMTVRQYQTALSSWRRAGVCLRALSAGRLRSTWRFYQLCGKLAHKKSHLTHFGEEGGNSALIQKLRTEMTVLSGLALA